MEKPESFDQNRNMSRVKAGFKGGKWFANPVKVPARTIVDGWPMEVKEKLDAASIKQGMPTDPWNSRR